MSSSGYRRDFVPRGGGAYTRGRGRGGFKQRPRYWDSDDYYDRDKGRGGKRRYSRSRSRSRSQSRSYSRSRSKSRSRSRSRSMSPRDRRRSNEYPRRSSLENPSHEPAAVAAPGISPAKGHYNNAYVHQPMKAVENVEANNWRPAAGFASEFSSSNGKEKIVMDQELLQRYQPHSGNMDDPSLTFSGYGYPPNIPNENVPQLYHQPPAIGGKPIQQGGDSDSTSHKKKKEKRKKKKSRRKSSSSSSSSSDSSSEESRQKRKSKRDSDDSSNSSSESEGRHQKEKEKPTAPEATGSRLTVEQRQALITQQDSYKQKLEIIEREIGKLQTKEDELKKTRADIRLVEENLKLQAELKGRCKAVHIVLEKISNVLVADKSVGAEKAHPPVPPPPPKISEPTKKLVEMKPAKIDLTDVDYIDNGQHWCRLCNAFPETIEQMLNHFHSTAHRDTVEQLGIDDKPWNKKSAKVDQANPSKSAKKLPLRGMQFFSPVEGWYCRLCNNWMGDQISASVHLKSLEHNSNYCTFLDEHPEWEEKWSKDREKARQRALGDGKQDLHKSRFDHPPPAAVNENDDNNGRSGSIRVQMRNTIKLEDLKGSGDFINKFQPKDSKIDEWMGKPQKAPLDLVDTQKFAEIVRQRHGVKKEEEAAKLRENALEQARSLQSKGRTQEDKEIGGREIDKKRPERVELQISARENRDRDRYRDNRGGAGGGSRRRSRSRSRSRSRDRGYHGRRRSRSRSRSRDRRDREKNARGTEPLKKQMPIIGKMPLYKRPIIAGKDKLTVTVSSDNSQVVASSAVAASSHYDDTTPGYVESFSHHTMATSSGYDHPPREHSNYVPANKTIDEGHNNVFVPVPTVATVVGLRPDTDLKPPGEKEAPGGTNLPDDLQQALDIIYRGGGSGKPITVPPPNFPQTTVPPPRLPPPMMGVPPPAGQAPYDYTAIQSAFSSSTNYYEPYQMPFDGYGASDMEEISVAGNVPVVENPVADKQETDKIETSSSSTLKTVVGLEIGDDDDMDDLRMLGIDVDDVAVVRK